ncbi:MAG: hypothetical protein WAU13_00415, partial [Albidovulum sp.]
FAPRALFDRPVLVSRTASSWVGFAILMVLVTAGFAGSHDPYGNLLPLMLWTGIWVGLTVLTALFGNLWQNLDPWRGPVRFLRQGIGWRGTIGLARWGHWPAVIGYLGFAWFEIVSLAPDNPQQLAAVVLIYWLVILALAVAEGEDWLERGEFLTVYFGFVARIAPFWAEAKAGRLAVMAGLPGAQVLAMPPLPASAIAFVVLVLASVSFDGLAETFWWLAHIGINPLEFPGRSAVRGVNTVGLLALWGLSAATILGAITLGLRLGGVRGKAVLQALGPLTLSFLPIAAGYHIAHYFVAMLTGGQYLAAALSDPFGQGWDIFGLGPHWVSFGYMAQTGTVRVIWNCQFAIILGAHVLALILAHKLGDRIGGGIGFRAHLPLTLLMVLYTVLGLWLLSAPVAG